ncbi:MAG: ACT domain-containing protein [Planctomycetota bacterium]
MNRSLVMTMLGRDRTGLVDAVASRVAALGGNWVESRLTRLAGHFAGVVRIDIDADQLDALARTLDTLGDEGLTVHVAVADEDAATPALTARLRLTFVGHDRPGIVREVAHALAERGVNVDELTTGVTSAPMTGEPMFTAVVDARPPADADRADLATQIEELAEACELDIDIQAVDPVEPA